MQRIEWRTWRDGNKNLEGDGKVKRKSKEGRIREEERGSRFYSAAYLGLELSLAKGQ
jgi:hypothetical protein